MKLIDLLVQELPKRGGWPEGAICVVQSFVDGELYFYDKPYDASGAMRKNIGRYTIPKASDVKMNDFGLSPSISKCQYQSALAASQKVEWSRDGLPPVGCEVEYIPGMLVPASSDDNKPIEPTIIKIVAHEKYPNGGNDVVVGVWMAKSGGMRSSVFSPRCLVNIRSEADKRRDVAAKEMVRHANDDENRGFDAGLRNCLSIYDSIAAGKIPGVKLED